MPTILEWIDMGDVNWKDISPWPEYVGENEGHGDGDGDGLAYGTGHENEFAESELVMMQVSGLCQDCRNEV